MPMYDFQCPEGHEFEVNVRIAQRNEPVPCEVGGCELQAKRVEISFNPNNSILDHGIAANRDAARAGTYDPYRPSKRVMGSGRDWRKSR